MGIYLIADSASSLHEILGTLLTIVNVALGLSFVIFVHELGHFLAAKLCGVKCEKFYVGFDVPSWKLAGLRMPSRICRFQWGETEYGIGIIPLGGYVKMLGQDDNPANAKKEAERIRAGGAPAGGVAAPVVALDPRSFPAKTVPQRMLIISAGIIMNIIFAALMAAVAFRMGVNYITCDFAGAVPGSSAWRAGITPGDRVLQVGRKGEEKQFVRDTDLREQALFSGLSSDDPKPIDLLIRKTNGQTEWVSLAPRRASPDAPPTLGVRFAHSNEVAGVVEYMAAANTKPQLKPGDRVIAVNGQELENSHQNEVGQFAAWQYSQLVEQHLDEPITLTVERTEAAKTGSDASDKKTSRLEVEVPPQPLRWLEFQPRMGPVTMVLEGSAAQQAGLKVGDLITGMNGKSIGDPLTLPQRFAALGDQPIRLTVWQRDDNTKEYQRREITVVPTTTESNLADNSDLGLEGIGVAYTVRNVVQNIVEGSAAAKLLRRGDRIVSFQRVAKNAEVRSKLVKEYHKTYFTEIPLSPSLTWIQLNHAVQTLAPDVDVSLKIRRGKEELKVQLAASELRGHYYVERGIEFLPFEREFVADSWGQALTEGIKETKDRTVHVATVLKLLFTGRVSADNLGGPIRIAAVAGHEANLSVSRLLMFLTFLSANLALINALPIPVLDGGHFLFLTIELVRRRPVPEEWQQRLSFLGFAALILLMFFVLFNDIRWFAEM